MNTSANATDSIAVVGLIEPVAGAATYTTVYIDAGSAHAFLATIAVGTAGTSVDAKIEQASDSAGTGVKDLTGAAITQIDGDGESAVIQFKPADLDTANDFDHFRLSITTVGATAVAGGSVVAVCPRYAPLADAAKIDEVVTV
jgi:flavin-binding protein dodecin